MSYPFINRLSRLLPPLLLLAACAIALRQLDLLPLLWRAFAVEALPLLALAAAFLLSLKFQRSRYGLLLLVIGLGALLRSRLPAALPAPAADLLFGLLFVNGLVFSLDRDRALFSLPVLIRFALLGLQAAAAVYLLQRYPGHIDAILGGRLFVLPGALEHYLWLADAVVAAAFACMLLHAILALAANSSLQATFLGCQAALFGIASTYPHDALAPLLLAACSLMVATAIVLDAHDMAYRDELTRLPSRRALGQRLPGLGRRYTIAMLDIDHFKKFNDTHGHDVGDEVLKMVAAQIARAGGGGRAYRYGGEEFALVFPRRSAAQVEAHLEELCRKVENYRMIARAARRGGKGSEGWIARLRRGAKHSACRRLAVTISIGFAERGGVYRSPEAVIKAADRALYRAKKKGRNRVST